MRGTGEQSVTRTCREAESHRAEQVQHRRAKAKATGFEKRSQHSDGCANGSLVRAACGSGTRIGGTATAYLFGTENPYLQCPTARQA